VFHVTGVQTCALPISARAAADATADLAASAADVAGVKVVAARLEGLDAKGLREAVDQLKARLGDAVILLASGQDGRASLVAGVQLGRAPGRGLGETAR